MFSGEGFVEVKQDIPETKPVDPEERKKQKRIEKLEKRIKLL